MLVGFFVGAGQTGGLIWIRDIFFLHEIPRKINIWSGFIIASPYLGPFMASFVVWGLTWRWVYWIYAILNYVGLLLIMLFADETLFDRRLPANQQPAWRSRPLRLAGVERHGTHKVVESCCRPFVAIFKLPVLIITVFYFLNFAWTIGVNATLATWLAKYYHFDGRQTGLFYFAPIVGCIIGAISGHWLHDFFARWYIRRHSGTMHPEARLYIIYFASGIVGLFILLLGQALQHTWHYMAVAVFDAAQLIGVNIISTAVNAYLGDAYPEAPGEMDTWIVMGRTMGGFMATYIELPWVKSAGPGTALGVQAGITWAALVLVVILQVWGKTLRNWQGPIKIPGQM
ncbi:MFS general substrate transporter [Hortaea werneckii]|nr:MFS general substrate transporter [Hortaea werneckii]KAI7601625.1 MFS general substrate transporter [Hortaea werneckii]KAI7684153.1 MFS general substrate transporter [Hortaea werneckii]